MNLIKLAARPIAARGVRSAVDRNDELSMGFLEDALMFKHRSLLILSVVYLAG